MRVKNELFMKKRIISEKEKKQLIFNAAEKLIKTFSKCDDRENINETNEHIQRMISEYRLQLKNIKEGVAPTENKIEKRFNEIDYYFDKLKLPQPYIAIERANNSNYYTYIDGYDDVLYSSSNTIEQAIGGLSQKTKDWYSKKVTVYLQNKKEFENKSKLSKISK